MKDTSEHKWHENQSLIGDPLPVGQPVRVTLREDLLNLAREHLPVGQPVQVGAVDALRRSVTELLVKYTLDHKLEIKPELPSLSGVFMQGDRWMRDTVRGILQEHGYTPPVNLMDCIEIWNKPLPPAVQGQISMWFRDGLYCSVLAFTLKQMPDLLMVFMKKQLWTYVSNHMLQVPSLVCGHFTHDLKDEKHV